MALTTIGAVRLIPGFTNAVTKTDAWLTALVNAASAAIKKYCKQGLELTNYVEFYNGNLEVSLVLRQKPAWAGSTTIATGSNGAVLPQATINVESTASFNPNGGWIAAQCSNTPQSNPNRYTPISYTGVTGTTFTGCAGGTGTLNSATDYNAVGSPVVWSDSNGRWGQAPSSFPASNVLAPGVNCALFVDGVGGSGNPVSNRALLQRTGGGGMASGYFPQPYQGGGKLASRSLPVWERGQGNIKVAYAAGFSPIPDDLAYACNLLVANMVRFQPTGVDLSSESLGAYSYSVLQRSLDVPELGSLSQTLALYRETSI